ncbi:hypothetical protein [Flavobacterium taihuense]|uniref:Uncharacterized protein n=1 Tax=Flavobacterium taihuense TaxID=2857508 RepID=A0ABS6XUB3_9FLAO|nr:hypothetical protein [Flavobacterium taihuense]MBW4360269.1 hypothetical protein [Flavobacterium taihuense]
MKTKFLFLLLLLFISSYGFSQSVNDYVAVIVPVKYDFVKQENQYRLNTLTKFNLHKAGFQAFYTNEAIPKEYSDRCSLLNVDVLKENGFLITKLYVILKDCNGKVIFKSEVGKSKEKDYEVAYAEALNAAFTSVYALHYKYNGKAVVANQNASVVSPAIVSVVSMAVPVPTAAVAVNVPSSSAEPDGSVLFAQPIKNGFQLVDSTPKVVMKAYKTTNPAIYLASKGDIQGTLVLKDNQWYFEYYEKDTLMSEKIKVKF